MACRAMLFVLRELSFGNPAVMAFSALDPWFCVPAFQRVCPFALVWYQVWFYGFKKSVEFSYSIHP